MTIGHTTVNDKISDPDGHKASAKRLRTALAEDGIAISHAKALELAGITRDTLLALSGANVRMVSLAELLDADEVFVCGTAAEVAPVAQIEQREYGDNPVSRALAAQYQRIVRGEDTTHASWLTTV